MKKVLLIMTDMECGGVQVSLLNFIKELLKYDVDITLLLDSASGEWFNRLPHNIHVKEVLYQCEGFHKLIRPHRKVNIVQDIVYHGFVHLIDNCFKQKENRNKRYTFLLNHIKVPDETYDIAIDYHGYGFITTSILAQKINAKYKAVFIHDENMDCMRMAECDLQKIDEFFSVSRSCQRIFAEKFPEYADRSSFFPNILDIEDIKEKAEAACDVVKEPGSFMIVTVGRVMGQKGYDFAVEVAAELKKCQFPFKWYCIGDGLCMNEIKALIHEKKVEDEFFMLGRKDNPYPYIKMADLYVQTSRHEGFGLAIAEALVLDKVVLSTKIECVEEQIVDGYNGFIKPMNVLEFSGEIVHICTNNEMCIKIQKNLQKRKYLQNSSISTLLQQR